MLKYRSGSHERGALEKEISKCELKQSVFPFSKKKTMVPRNVVRRNAQNQLLWWNTSVHNRSRSVREYKCETYNEKISVLDLAELHMHVSNLYGRNWVLKNNNTTCLLSPLCVFTARPGVSKCTFCQKRVDIDFPMLLPKETTLFFSIRVWVVDPSLHLFRHRSTKTQYPSA